MNYLQKYCKELKESTDEIKKLRYKLGLPKRFRKDRKACYSRIFHIARKKPYKTNKKSLINILIALRNEAYAQGKIKAIKEINNTN